VATAETAAAAPVSDAATPVADQILSSSPTSKGLLQSNPKRPTFVVNLINKHREILQAFRESAQYLPVVAQDSVTDVPRWSYQKQFGPRRRCRLSLPDVDVLASLGRLGTDPRHFPAELLPSLDPQPQQLAPQEQRKRQAERNGVPGQSRNNKSTRWEELAHRETITAEVGDPDSIVSVSHTNSKHESQQAPTAVVTGPGGGEPDEVDAAEELPREDEEEELEDYTKDYYESEGESDDGDGEATF
jgi:hypothetical protein